MYGCICGGMRKQRDGELVLLEIQGIHSQCYEKMGIKKKSSRISPWN